MTIRMKNLDRLTLTEMEEFLSGNQAVDFERTGLQTYELIEKILNGQKYRKRSKLERGTVSLFLRKVTGISRAQINRLIRRWKKTGKVERQPARRPSFAGRFTAADIGLLAEMDAVHEDLSGPAVRRLFFRAHEYYGDARYRQLATISVSHLYNLRRSAAYRRLRIVVRPTRARQIAIAERRKPAPRNRPGFLRVDTVHQGQRDGQPGVYHLNAVDTVTQWEEVGCVTTICERDLIPVLEAMLHQFPFRILGFHCDNGAEFINHTVAKLLNKLLIEFTKSRPYRTTDNAQVEGKNGSVIRKLMGHGPIPAQHAEALQKFYTAHLNPYLNFHRPCGFATILPGARGKRRRVYRADDYRTPYEKLTSLPKWERFLKPGITKETLERQARRLTDVEAARRMQNAKTALLTRCRLQPNGLPR
jgi:transposase InsO family protein